MKYSAQIGKWLQSLGYTHYFYVGGGNIMHLTESLSHYLTGVPVVHEVAAGVAAEYFNEISGEKKALALVTAGPGLTNIVTAMAGAFLESRELLVLGGQVKTSDLATGELRSRGIQEINGVKLVSSISKCSYRFNEPISAQVFFQKVSESWRPRKGPVFLEVPLDIQAAEVVEEVIVVDRLNLPTMDDRDLERTVAEYNMSQRPILLLGGGVEYSTAGNLQRAFDVKNIPIMTTYNGADRVDGDANYYLGRPNTWGQRSSNIIIQKADLIIAVGTRLGMQQTGFNWKEFGRNARIIHIDIDPAEINKGHPITHEKYTVDANDFICRFVNSELIQKILWLARAQKIRGAIPRIEPINNTGDSYISPYEFIINLEELTNSTDIIIPCSSGSAFTLSMQLYKQKYGQRILTNKSLASMGYGLSGAIGAALVKGQQGRTILIEGDGGFAQNLQELGTAELNKLNLKIFIFNDQGHASIRMTQKNYFNGRYLGCDRSSGLGLPSWNEIFKAYNIPVLEVNKGFHKIPQFIDAFDAPGIHAFIVQIDPEQTYLPKIASKITSSGSMESSPIDQMSPEINYLEDIDWD